MPMKSSVLPWKEKPIFLMAHYLHFALVLLYAIILIDPMSRKTRAVA